MADDLAAADIDSAESKSERAAGSLATREREAEDVYRACAEPLTDGGEFCVLVHTVSILT